MRKTIRKAVVLGSGIMGSGIACHLANVGLEVLLLDRIPENLSPSELDLPDHRNKLANASLSKAIKAKPATLFTNDLASNIKTGNFEDDLEKVSDCDWIIEAIIEDPGIKAQLYEKVDRYRKEGAIVSTNTSGIPVSMLTQGQSNSFKDHFIGTHFFNPPRYLSLLEIIPGKDTPEELTQFMMEFGRRKLGKETVLCKDTPAFIANRVGVYSILKILELTEKYAFDIETVDALTGTAIGRPKTGTFRLQDLIGVDVGVHVLKSVSQNCPNDPYLRQQSEKELPAYIKFLLKNGFLGNKSGQGFYKKTNEYSDEGKRIIHALDLKSLEYRPRQKPGLTSLQSVKRMERITERINHFFEEGDQGNDFIREYFLGLFSYVSQRIPEISDQIHSIDTAMKGGYGWEFGPFECWDMVGLVKARNMAKTAGIELAPWVDEMIEEGYSSFYTFEQGMAKVYDPVRKGYYPIPGSERYISLKKLDNNVVFENSEARLYDIEDGVLCVSFESKNNVLGEGTGEVIHKAIDLAENEGWKGVVIGNDGPNFTVGANLMLVAMLAFQQEWSKLEQLTKAFQDMNMRLRYSAVPVVTATRGYVFGGGIEMSMHADGVAAAAESYIGLVEAGVGLIPGGGGTKEFAKRLSDTFFEGDIKIPKLISMFRTIAMAEVATSARMAFDFNYLLPERDQVILNNREIIFEAKKQVLHLADDYLPPVPAKINVLGQAGLATLYAAINEFQLGKFISGHDALIARKTANVMCGGNLTAEQEVSEQYLLDLEREAFVSLCGEKKTLDRIQHMLQFNKPLRN